MKRGKKYIEAAKLVDRANLYDVAEAFDLVVKTSSAKFDETVEAHIKLGVDSRHADQQESVPPAPGDLPMLQRIWYYVSRACLSSGTYSCRFFSVPLRCERLSAAFPSFETA